MTTENNAKTDNALKAVQLAVFTCLEQYGWRHLTLVHVADEAKISLEDLHHHATAKEDLLDLTISYIENQTLMFLDEDFLDQDSDKRPSDANNPYDPYDPEHAFDVLFSRFEAATPHKNAIQILYKDLKKDPLNSAHLIPRFLKALERLLHLSGIKFEGPFAPLQLRGFGLLYLKAFHVWLEDTTPDQEKTMAETNKLATTYIPCVQDPCRVMDLL